MKPAKRSALLCLVLVCALLLAGCDYTVVNKDVLSTLEDYQTMLARYDDLISAVENGSREEAIAAVESRFPPRPTVTVSIGPDNFEDYFTWTEDSSYIRDAEGAPIGLVVYHFMVLKEGYEIADERDSWAEIGVLRHGASYFGRLSIDFDTRAWEGQPRDTYSFDSSGSDRMYHDLFADRWVLTGYSDSFNLNPADPSAACVFLMDRFEVVRVEGSLVLYAD